MFRYDIIVRGTVQGVGFRYFVLESAKKFGLTGWVRNLGTGEVEISAEGDAGRLEGFAAEIRTRHPWARVEGMSISKKEIKERSSVGFTITV